MRKIDFSIEFFKIKEDKTTDDLIQQQTNKVYTCSFLKHRLQKGFSSNLTNFIRI